MSHEKPRISTAGEERTSRRLDLRGAGWYSALLPDYLTAGTAFEASGIAIGALIVYVHQVGWP